MSEAESEQREMAEAAARAAEMQGELVTPDESEPIASVPAERREVVATYATVTEADVLLSYAWLCNATLEHIHRLHYDGKSRRTVETMQSKLTKAGYIERHDRGQRKAVRRHTAATTIDGTQTGRLPSSWSLTPAGHEQIRQLEQYPTIDAKGQYRARSRERSEVLRNHSLMVSDVVVELICRARPLVLSGVFVGRDLRLDPERARPCMDALLMLHFHGSGCPVNGVPWTKDPASGYESSWRYAIEVDTGTESVSTVVAKAAQYAGVLRGDNTRWRQWWEGLYGAWPLVLVVLPDDRARFDAVFDGWVSAWSDGAWAMTMVSWLADGKWLMYHHAKQRSAWISLATPRQAPALPAPPKALPAPPDVLAQAREHLIAVGHDVALVEQAISLDMHPFASLGECTYFPFDRLPVVLQSDAVLVIAQRDDTVHAVEVAERAELGYLVLTPIVTRYTEEQKARAAAEAKAKADAEAAAAARVQAEALRRVRIEAERRALAARRAQEEARQAIERARYATWGPLYDGYKGALWLRDVALIPFGQLVLWACIAVLSYLSMGVREHPRRAVSFVGLLGLAAAAWWGYRVGVWAIVLAWDWPRIGGAVVLVFVGVLCGLGASQMSEYDGGKRAGLWALAVGLLVLGVLAVPGVYPWVVDRWPAWAQWPQRAESPAPAHVPVLPQVPAPAALPGEVNGYPVCGQAVAKGQRVNVRVGPGTAYEVLYKLAAGEQVYLLCDATERGNGYVWQRVIRDSDVLPGWVATRYLRRLE